MPSPSLRKTVARENSSGVTKFAYTIVQYGTSGAMFLLMTIPSRRNAQ